MLAVAQGVSQGQQELREHAFFAGVRRQPLNSLLLLRCTGTERLRCCWQLDWGALERLEAKPEFKPSEKAADCFPTQQLQVRATPLPRVVIDEQASCLMVCLRVRCRRMRR